MSKLAKAFAASEKQEERAQSLFNNIFSSPIFRGFYEKENPEVDIKMTGSDLEQKRLTYLINTIAKNSPSGKKYCKKSPTTVSHWALNVKATVTVYAMQAIKF